MSLSERLRDAADTVRRKPMPLADFIPQLQQAADEIDAARPRVTPELQADLLKLAEMSEQAALEMLLPPLTDKLLEKMLDAYKGYQCSGDRGYAQTEEGMRLALVAAGFYSADTEVIEAA